MKGTLSNFIIFAVGATIGSAVAWRIAKTKYEQIAQEEINSVKEVFARRLKQDEQNDNENERYSKEEAFENALRRYSATSEQKEETKAVVEPYVISPEDFGDKDDYDTVSLTYYADDVLTDEHDEVIEDVDGIIGRDSLTHFGEYEEDSVFVRNDTLKCDYEILKDVRKYYED